MKWFESITFNSPLTDVRLLTQSPAQDWSQHVDEREKAAYEKGRREGENALREQLISQRNEIGGLLNGVVESLRNAVPQLVQQTESALIELSLESAQKIIAGQPIDAKMVEAVVQEALHQVEDTAEVTLQLHPDDLALLQKHHSNILDGSPNSAPVRFVGSAEVSRGGCLVRTRFGVIDARRETKIGQLREALAV